jgi:hypothetical protein
MTLPQAQVLRLSMSHILIVGVQVRRSRATGEAVATAVVGSDDVLQVLHYG